MIHKLHSKSKKALLSIIFASTVAATVVGAVAAPAAFGATRASAITPAIHRAECRYYQNQVQQLLGA